MITNKFSLILSVLLYFNLNTLSIAIGSSYLGNIGGCSIDSVTPEFYRSFSGVIFYYPWESYDTVKNKGVYNTANILNSQYLDGGYTGTGNIISQYHSVFTRPGLIAEQAFASTIKLNATKFCGKRVDGCANVEVWNTLQNFYYTGYKKVVAPITNFGFHMTSLLVPPTTGNYTITLNYVEDVGIVSLGSGNLLSESCCDNYSPTGSATANNKIYSNWTTSGPSGVNQITAYLYKGVSYPISIFYANVGNLGAIDLTYTDPSGTIQSDFSKILDGHFDIRDCSYKNIFETTLPWDQLTTASTTKSLQTTTQVLNTLVTPQVTYTEIIKIENRIVYTPIPTITSTTTTNYKLQWYRNNYFSNFSNNNLF